MDFAFAAMASLLAFPDNYGGKVFNVDKLEGGNPSRPMLETDASPELQKEAARFRKTPAGRFVMELYDKHRMK